MTDTATITKGYTGNVMNVVTGKANAMAKGSFDLIAAVAWAYVDGVYWTVNGKADVVTEEMHKALESLNYGKSQKYALAKAGFQVARAFVKRFGTPRHTAEGINVFWSTLAATTDTESDTAIALIVSAIKDTFKVSTVRDLFDALNPSKAGTKAEKTIAEKVAALLEKADANEQSTVAMATVPLLSATDRATVMTNWLQGLSDDDLLAMMNAEMARRATATAEPLADAA